FFQANKRLTGLHRLLLPRSRGPMAPQGPTTRRHGSQSCHDNVSVRFPSRASSGRNVLVAYRTAPAVATAMVTSEVRLLTLCLPGPLIIAPSLGSRGGSSSHDGGRVSRVG